MRKNSRKTILIIDDEPTIGQIIKRLIKKDNYSIQVCTSSSEALIATKQAMPSLIISDFNLPCCSNGADLCLGIQQSTRETVPVIIISGQTDNESRARQLGFEFMGKPLRREKLLPLVEAYLS